MNAVPSVRDFGRRATALLIAAAAVSPDTGMRAQPAARDWGRVSVESADGKFTAVLENSRLRVTYARNDGKDKIAEFFCQVSGKQLGQFDSRHSPTRPGFFTLKDARVSHDEKDRKTVRLDFGSRVQDVSVFPDCPVLEVDYHTVNDAGHTIDRGGDVGEVVAHGATAWLEQRKRVPTEQAASLDMDQRELYPMYRLSYYHAEWAPPGPLSYRGWMILGLSLGNGGYGLLLPAEKVKWLKLMNGPNPRGFERLMRPPYRAYYYRVAEGGPERIVAMGREIVDGAFANVGLKPNLDGK